VNSQLCKAQHQQQQQQQKGGDANVVKQCMSWEPKTTKTKPIKQPPTTNKEQSKDQEQNKKQNQCNRGKKKRQRVEWLRRATELTACEREREREESCVCVCVCVCVCASAVSP
jgi:hypothetical protein